MEPGAAEWSTLPEDVAPRILVHVLLEYKVPYRQIDCTYAYNQKLRRKFVGEMRLLGRAFASVLMPLALVHAARSKPQYVDRFVEGVLRIHAHLHMEGYKCLGQELKAYLHNAFYVTSNVHPFHTIAQRHYYSAIAGTTLRLLRDGTIRLPTHRAVGEMARDVENIFMALYYKTAGYNNANLTWCFHAHLPSPGAVICSLLSPNTWERSYEEFRDHPKSVIV